MIHFTNSKGERLPEDINKVANRYYDGEFKPDSNQLSLNSGFLFSSTKEGYFVWECAFCGNYKPFYDYKQARKAEIIAEIEKLQNELKEL